MNPSGRVVMELGNVPLEGSFSVLSNTALELKVILRAILGVDYSLSQVRSKS